MGTASDGVILRNMRILLRLGAILLTLSALAQQRAPVTSHITIMDRDGKNARVIFSSPDVFEAPNWSPDGKYLLLNSRGKLWKLALTGGEPQPVDTGTVKSINNDHGISPMAAIGALGG